MWFLGVLNYCNFHNRILQHPTTLSHTTIRKPNRRGFLIVTPSLEDSIREFSLVMKKPWSSESIFCGEYRVHFSKRIKLSKRSAGRGQRDIERTQGHLIQCSLFQTEVVLMGLCTEAILFGLLDQIYI